jgi:SNF2 family DNA or RNA helicase
MTGAPIPNSPTDAWAQATIVTPHTVPKTFGKFRDELMLKVAQFKYVPKSDAVDRAFAALQPAVRFTLSDVTELPEAVGLNPPRIIDVEMGPTQAKIYKQMADSCYAAVQSQEITAANAAACMMKLLQVAAGWVYTKDGKTVALDNAKRIEALLDAINATDRKVLVFASFKHALAGISAALTAEGIEHATISGDTSEGNRAQTFNLFQNTGKYRVLLAHPQCLAHGITLTAADTVIWFGPVTSLEIYDQANHRIRRVGQKHKQLFLHLQSTPVEKHIYTLLANKQRVQDTLLDLFEAATE